MSYISDGPIRPLSPDEESRLRRILRGPGVGVARLFGLLAGLGALMLAVTFFLGTPYDPDVFPMEVLVVGLVAVVCGGAASSVVRDPRAALVKAEVVDVSAVVTPGPNAPYGAAGYVVGPLTVYLPRKHASVLVTGQLQRVAIARGLAPMGKRGGGIVPDRGLLLSVNGSLILKPIAVSYLLQPPAGTFATPTYPPATSATSASKPAPTGDRTFCNQCGRPNTVDYRFCSGCGAPRPVVGPTR